MPTDPFNPAAMAATELMRDWMERARIAERRVEIMRAALQKMVSGEFGPDDYSDTISEAAIKAADAIR